MNIYRPAQGAVVDGDGDPLRFHLPMPQNLTSGQSSTMRSLMSTSLTSVAHATSAPLRGGVARRRNLRRGGKGALVGRTEGYLADALREGLHQHNH
jgi:hypothetical protein